MSGRARAVNLPIMAAKGTERPDYNRLAASLIPAIERFTRNLRMSGRSRNGSGSGKTKKSAEGADLSGTPSGFKRKEQKYR